MTQKESSRHHRKLSFIGLIGMMTIITITVAIASREPPVVERKFGPQAWEEGFKRQ